MVVQRHVLNWLYSVLTSEYHDVNRTYNDVAQALSQYPSLLPRTDVHTFPNGTSALLLHISGTIPVNFRGTTYRFPISIWVPHAYPREPPLVYVTPTETMVVRPGQHVDPQGQVYHPYLVGWADFWDKSNLFDFLGVLRDIFAKEPPVVARGQAQQRPPSVQPQATPTPPPVPPLPQELAARPPSSIQSPPIANGGPQPPPPPPKPGQQASRADGPPLPPLPPGVEHHSSRYGSPALQQSPSAQPPQNNRMSRYDSAPPLPPAPQQQQGPPQGFGFPHAAPHLPPYQGQPLQAQYQGGAPPVPVSPADTRRMSSLPPQNHQHYASPPPLQQPWQQGPPQAIPPPPQQKPPPPPDLMDDLTLDIPSPSSVPAPPIPPNPEKDALLQQLAGTLHQMRNRTREQNDSSMQGLQAQRTAMLNAMSTMQSEIGALAQLSNLLQNNTNILRDTIRRADETIESSKALPEPDIDQLLVAPTVVGNQLYELVAEERALADAIFVLGRAVERGRVAPAVFAKTTRSLAREWYLKKALVKKIGLGMGLHPAV
ncbi:hypothetical protein KVR01_001740 [Diaporthe batatas]|uniref:ubiquitin-binding ESCRT-I subunit protein STP22 n=1 Tax=Diaporthe batatas TaxID=748121 RepID=UPI001D059D7B|nr:ubiquitin-binding ESCRT-I subunit protein STP22 [Diaporthe batatas]KAG8168991.1 hypothetical protein KVR01_001740 [Diaporthe batatas]